jgi:hypothetical protein
MKLARDIVATVLTALAVIAYAATHEEWNVYLIGGSHRWATGAIVLLGAAVFAIEAFRASVPPMLFAMLGTLAVVMAGLAFWTASLTPISILAAAVACLWLATTFEDVREHAPRRLIHSR